MREDEFIEKKRKITGEWKVEPKIATDDEA